MSKFDRSQTALIEKVVDENVEHPRIGRVTQVYEHGAVDDDSNFEVDVDLIGDGEADITQVPIISPGGNDTIDIPKVKDKVLVVYSEEGNFQPYVLGTAWTNKDRAPVGRAGMWRKRFDSDGANSPSPAGSGDVFVTGYTGYDKEGSFNSKYDLEPEDALVQITKHSEGDNLNPQDQPDLPMKLEFYDSPKNDAAHITIELNMDNGSGSDATWGIKFDVKSGEFQIVDPEGFGIHAKGDGNFDWHHKDITMNEVSGPTGPLNL